MRQRLIVGGEPDRDRGPGPGRLRWQQQVRSSGGGGGGGKSAATAQSAADLGGMDALVAAAKKEGTLNIIAVPRDWAGYGAIIDGFSAKYGIKINSENPDGSSGDEINALKSTKGQTSAPDVVDIGNSFALSGCDREGLFAPYKVATWADIPDGLKDPGGLWFSDYGGYISIGCNASQGRRHLPEDLQGPDNPAYKGKVALNGDPTSANAAFRGVWAAALANGGSADNIQPGIDFFQQAEHRPASSTRRRPPRRRSSPVRPRSSSTGTTSTSATRPSSRPRASTWTTNVPTDGLVTGYYAQAISIDAPHPAAARLWEEYLYSQDADGGQNGWLKGSARPIELRGHAEERQG